MTEAPTNASGAAAVSSAVSAQFAGDAGAQVQQQELPPEADHARYRQLRDKLQAELNERTEKISTNPETDNGTKHRTLSALWDQAMEADKKIGELYQKELEDNISEQEQKVFRIPPNLMDSVRSSYQMVTNELAYVGIEEGDSSAGALGAIEAGREKLEAMYERATRTRDKALQLAIFQYATEKGIHHLRDRHLETSKDLSRAWEGYTAARLKLADWTSREENLIQRLDGRRGIVKPPEVRWEKVREESAGAVLAVLESVAPRRRSVSSFSYVSRAQPGVL